MILSISGKIGSGKDTVGSIIQYLYYINSDIHEDRKVSYEEFCKTDRANNLLISSVVPEIKKWADKLKDMVSILLGCTREQLEDRVFKETPLGEEWWYYKSTFMDGNSMMYSYLNYNGSTKNKELVCLTPRLLLQLLGTECGRKIIHPNVWVNATMADYIGKDYSTCTCGYDNPNCNHEDITEYPNWIITDTRFPNEADAVKSRGGINIRLKRIETDLRTINQHESETALDDYSFDYVIDNNGTIEDLIIKVKEILIKENIL